MNRVTDYQTLAIQMLQWYYHDKDTLSCKCKCDATNWNDPKKKRKKGECVPQIFTAFFLYILSLLIWLILHQLKLKKKGELDVIIQKAAPRKKKKRLKHSTFIGRIWKDWPLSVPLSNFNRTNQRLDLAESKRKKKRRYQMESIQHMLYNETYFRAQLLMTQHLLQVWFVKISISF